MSTFKARGIVIKESVAGESDKSVTLFLKGYGKVTVYSRGARKPNSKYLAGTQIFAYSDFVLFKKNNFYSTSQIDMIESFVNIRYGYDCLCAANYIAEMVDSVVLYEMKSDGILFLVLKTLSALNQKNADVKLILSAFNFKLLQTLGFSPNLSCCINCGASLPDGEYFINPEGLVCRNCKGTPHIKISKTGLYTINYILSSGPQNLFSFKLEQNFLSEIFKLSEIFVKAHLETDPKSRKLFMF